MSNEANDKSNGSSNGIKVHRVTSRRSFVAALGLSVTTSAALLGAGTALAQRRRTSDQKYSNDRDYYQNADIKAPISNQGRYSDGDRARPNDFKQPSARD